MTGFAIAGRAIAPGHPPYIVAELSANHNGSIDKALALIDAAASAGADAIKLQTYTADTITIDHNGPGFRIEDGPWHGRSLHELYREAHTPWDWHPPLFERAHKRGLAAFSSAFDATAVDFLESLNVPAYKIASFEAVDLPLIERVARTGKPIVISTGIADRSEIGEAVSTARNAGCDQILLLHCVSGYPAPAEDIHLATIDDLQHFGASVGLSDHTLGTTVAVAAIARGAVFVEKHLTISRTDGGPDAGFSLEPPELAELVTAARTAWSAIGRVNYERKPSEIGNAAFRRSLYAVADIAMGERFTPTNVRSIRPGYGLPPKELPKVLGGSAARDIARGTPLAAELVVQRDHKV